MQTSGHFSILSRRGFLAGCSGAAACLACPAVCRATAATPQSLVPNERMKLRLVYTHPDPKLEGWPYQGYDYESRKKELTERLRRACPNVDFLPVWAQEEADGKKVLEGDGEVDGYLVYLLGIPSSAARRFWRTICTVAPGSSWAFMARRCAKACAWPASLPAA